MAGKGEIDSKEYKDTIYQLSRTAPNSFTDSGNIIRVNYMELKKCKSNRQPKSMLKSNKSLQTFQHITEKNSQWEETVEVDILKNSLYKAMYIKGGNIHVLEKTSMLWMILAQKISASARFVASNINGLGKIMFICIASKTGARIWNNSGNSIINNTDEGAVAQLCLYFTEYYKSHKDSYADPVTVSYSIDATKNATLVAIHQKTGKIVGGAYPNNAIEFPENDSDALEIIEKFNGSKSGFKKLTELKLATVVMNNYPTGVSPVFQLLAQPHTTNFNSNFNQRCIKIVLKAESISRYKGYYVNFVYVGVDAVSCNSIFVKTNMLDLLNGKNLTRH